METTILEIKRSKETNQITDKIEICDSLPFGIKEITYFTTNKSKFRKALFILNEMALPNLIWKEVRTTEGYTIVCYSNDADIENTVHCVFSDCLQSKKVKIIKIV